jgi:TrpR-related protein YerC/YecD
LSTGTEELSEVLTLLRDPKEIQGFLTDLLTPGEIERFAIRWRNMKLLAEGLNREEIRAKTGTSLSTISRANRVVTHGTGIIQTLVDRLEKKRLL